MTVFSVMFGIGGWELLILLLPLMGLGILWIWAFVDILRGGFADSTQQVIWLLAVIFVPVIGTLLYLTIGRQSKKKLTP